MRKAMYLALLIMLTFLGGITIAEQDGPGEEIKQREELPAAEPGQEEISLLSEWREILLFGIAEEIIPVIEKLRVSRETALNRELNRIFAESVNNEVRIAILEYFGELREVLAGQEALSLLSGYDQLDRDLIIALVKYLSNIGFKDSLALLQELLDSGDISVSIAALKALGIVAGDSQNSSIVDFLLEKLNNADYNVKLKPEIILALGELGNRSAVASLIEIAQDSSQDKGMRMYAADSLGKIGDERAFPVLKNLFSEKDALLRAYAIAAVSHFDREEVVELLIQGLKDSNWRVRVSSAQGLIKRKAIAALDILMYKARKDPVRDVRIEAFKALGAVGDIKGLDLLRNIYGNDGENLDIRMAALDVLADKDLDATSETILAVTIPEEKRSMFETRVTERTARLLALKESPFLREIFEQFLQSENLVLRVQAIRGITRNKFTDLKGAIEKISKEDPNLNVRREALTSLEKW